MFEIGPVETDQYFVTPTPDSTVGRPATEATNFVIDDTVLNIDSQKLALINRGRISFLFPQTVTVKLGLSVRLYHISVSGDHRVNIEGLAPEAINVDPRAFSQMEFNPTEVGEFAIRHLDDALVGQVVVEEAPCLGS